MGGDVPTKAKKANSLIELGFNLTIFNLLMKGSFHFMVTILMFKF